MEIDDLDRYLSDVEAKINAQDHEVQRRTQLADEVLAGEGQFSAGGGSGSREGAQPSAPGAEGVVGQPRGAALSAAGDGRPAEPGPGRGPRAGEAAGNGPGSRTPARGPPGPARPPNPSQPGRPSSAARPPSKRGGGPSGPRAADPGDPEDAQLRSRITALAGRLGQLGIELPTSAAEGEADTLAALGSQAELSYLRARVDGLTDSIRKLTAESNEALQREAAAREELAAVRVERDRLRRTLEERARQSRREAQEGERLASEASAGRAAKQELEARVAQLERSLKAAQGSLDAKGKQLAAAAQSVERYRSQLQDTLDRERELQGKLREAEDDTGSKAARLSREKDALLRVVQKQQQLIDVLQRQKLHLQGGLALGITEKEFEKILELK